MRKSIYTNSYKPINRKIKHKPQNQIQGMIKMNKILIIGIFLLIASLGLSCVQATKVPNDTTINEQTQIKNIEKTSTINQKIEKDNENNNTLNQNSIQTQDNRKQLRQPTESIKQGIIPKIPIKPEKLLFP